MQKQQAQSVPVSKQSNSKGGIAMDKVIAKLQLLAENHIREINVPEEDRVNRVMVYKARNGKIVLKKLDPIGFSKCLFKHIAPLSQLLEVKIDQRLFQVNEEQSREDVLMNRLKLESGLQEITYNNCKYVPCGAASSLKEGRLWYSTEQVRDTVHKYFPYSEACSTYMGVLLSQGFSGEFKSDAVCVYEESDNRNDGMGYIKMSFAHTQGIYSQAQVRIIDPINFSAAKGTLLLMADKLFTAMFGDKDISINKTLIKSESSIFQSCIISVRSVARFMPMRSSFQVLQFVSPAGYAKLKLSIDKHLEEIFARFTNKEKAIEELKLRLIEEDGTMLVDTKLAMLLLSGLDIRHPWIQSRISSLWLKELSELALGGPIQFCSGMAAFDPSMKPGTVRFFNGSVFMNMKELSDIELGDADGDILGFCLDCEKRECIVLRYPLIQSVSIMKLRVVGEIPSCLLSNPLAVEVFSEIHRLSPIQKPDTIKKHTSLSQLVSVLLDGASGGGIGGSTLALSASVAHGKDDLTFALGFYSYCECLSFKHTVLNQPSVSPAKVLKELQSPAWFGLNPERLSDFQVVEYPGIVAENYNYVANKIQAFKTTLDTQKKPLSEFRGLIPIPKSFNRKAFIKIYECYKAYCKNVSIAIEKKDEELLNRTIRATEIIGMGMSEKDIALAWHISHLGSGLASFVIHLGINQIVKLLGHSVHVPVLKVVSNTEPQLTMKGFENTYQKNIDLCLKKLFAA